MNRFNHTSGVIALTLTDRPEAVHNRCVTKFLVPFFRCHVLVWIFCVGVGAFVSGMSQISTFFSYNKQQEYPLS